MTLFEPTLIVRRLAVFAEGVSVYDEIFHDGVNILRGTNSSGKSTIADFIFFALGGDFQKWKHQASLCDHVVAEFEINSQAISVRRRIESSGRQPMSIFFGPFDDAIKSAVQGWKVYPFQRGGDRSERVSEKESFSQTLFRVMGLPEVKGDAESNITMHQLLRLVFVDQLSPPDTLMRMEQFDSALTRNTVGDLLLGVYDDQLYSNQLKLAKAQKELASVTAQYESVLGLFQQTGHLTTLDEVNSQIRALEDQRQRVTAALEASPGITAGEATESGTEELRTAVSAAQENLSASENEAREIALEIADSKQFIESLVGRLSALDDANEVRSVLGELPLTNCPHCLAPLVLPASAHDCPLCKAAPTKEVIEKHAFRLRQELSFQIKESEAILQRKQKRLTELNRLLPGLNEAMKKAMSDYNISVANLRSVRDTELDRLWMTKGSLDARLEYLHTNAKAIDVFASLKEQKFGLESHISRLEVAVREAKSRQEAKRVEAHSLIEECAIYLLHNDLGLEETFRNANRLSFDFGHNTFEVNGENQFSASSMVYLKNSIRFAILWASVKLGWIRYPRLLICDNMEDKGMQPSRSQNFQNLIVALSSEFEVRHQIIFTTSMISPDLDKPQFCIGHTYGPGRKSLNIAPA